VEIAMQPRIEHKADLQVMGLETHVAGDASSLPALWRALMEREREIAGKVGDGSYGVTRNFDLATREFDYLAGFAVRGPGVAPDGMRAAHVPASDYAILECTLPSMMHTIHQTLHEWLPSSGYRHTGGPELEHYPPAFDPAVAGSVMYYYVPIAGT
jgi:AraC family transcriptional regulator